METVTYFLITLGLIYLGIGFLASWLTRDVLIGEHVNPKTVYYDIRVYVVGLLWLGFLIWLLIAIARESHDDLETEDLF